MLRQVYYEMRHQKMMTWVSICGTALSIFLIMALYMTDSIKTVEIAPENNRNRILFGRGMHYRDENREISTSLLSMNIIDKIYGNLDGIEKTSYISSDRTSRINAPGEEPVTVEEQRVDDEYWKIYNFNFIDGKPFDKAEVKDGVKKIILSRSTARQLFGEDNVVGRDVEVDWIRFTVCGVVDDVNPLLETTYGDIYVPYTPPVDNDDFMGSTQLILLMKEGVSSEYIKNQVENRYKAVNADIAASGKEIIYHLQPYNSEEGQHLWSNTSPDTEKHKRMMWLYYTVLLLLPAINLSSMTRSRLRHRVTEIGVRRAFGAKRTSIIWNLFVENLIITIIGGTIGLVLSVTFVSLASHLVFSTSVLSANPFNVVNATPSLGMLLRWQNFAAAILFCLILNILSATLPAWRASRIEPAEAIAKSR